MCHDTPLPPSNVIKLRDLTAYLLKCVIFPFLLLAFMSRESAYRVLWGPSNKIFVLLNGPGLGLCHGGTEALRSVP